MFPSIPTIAAGAMRSVKGMWKRASPPRQSSSSWPIY
jgi:hypothetical protein